MDKLRGQITNSAGSTTALQSSASSLNNSGINDRLLKLISDFVYVHKRKQIALDMAKTLGADDLIIFIKDQDIGRMLPALGFRQTMIDGLSWRRFLDFCLKKRVYQLKLKYLTDSDLYFATGIAYKDECILVLLNKEKKDFNHAQIVVVLPLLAALLSNEQRLHHQEAEINMLHQSATDTQSIARNLDTVRKHLQTALHDKEKEILTRKLTEEKLQFLAQASQILYSSLDYKITLANIARLAVPKLADWCIVYIKESDNSIHRLTISHGDKKADSKIQKIQKNVSINPKAKSGVPLVIRTGKPLLISNASPQILSSDVNNPRMLKNIIKSFSISSWICVPLKTRSDTFGAISFISASDRPKYTEKDLELAKELATRASVAIENARLYNDSQKAISLRDDFISIASHELKTPVTVLKMYIQVVKKQLSSLGENTPTLNKIEIQVNKLNLLIEDLLNIANFRSGKLEYHDRKFDMNKMVDEVIGNIQAISPKHKIIKKGRVAKQVWGDKDRISQVLINLLTNAIKYSPVADRVIISLDSIQNRVIVNVQDFGIGIDTLHLEKLFTRFYRVFDPIEKTFPGMGLGLYISNEIIKRYKGKMKVVSQKGKGSIFSFMLPYNYKLIDSTELP